MTPEELSRALREGDEPFLLKRRWIVGMALYNILAVSAILLS